MDGDKPDSPDTAPVLIEGMPAIECCAACHYWHREKLTKDQGGIIFAPCRRYPKVPAMVTQVMNGPRGPLPVQSQTMLASLMGGTEYCGEFKLRSAGSGS